MTDAELLDIEDHACPGAGACGGQFTANTMATVMELIGLAPMGTAAVPQVDKRKEDVALPLRRSHHGRRAQQPARRATSARARRSRTPSPAWPATGGSTNAVLHLLAMAREAEVPLSIDDFDGICARTPVFVDLKPGGRFMAADVDKAGGIRVIAKRLVEGKFVDGSAITVTGRTLRRRSRGGQRDARPGSDPAARPSPQAARRHRHSARQPGARRLRDQAGRPRQEAAPAARRASSIAKKTPCTPSPTARSTPATWW